MLFYLREIYACFNQRFIGKFNRATPKIVKTRRLIFLFMLGKIIENIILSSGTSPETFSGFGQSIRSPSIFKLYLIYSLRKVQMWTPVKLEVRT